MPIAVLKSDSITIRLPKHYAVEDFLSFHLRDKENIAEIVSDQTLRKGFVWQQHPAELSIAFKNNTAVITWRTTAPSQQPNNDEITKLGKHMLGLFQPVEQFATIYTKHPIVGKLIKNQQGLRIYQSLTPFEALVWAIIGQQISVTAAIAIRRRFILAFGLQHPSGIWCFPTAEQFIDFDEEKLRATGFSNAKAIALKSLCEVINNGALTLNVGTQTDNIQQLSERLLSIKGIGPWTVNYALLRGFNYLDGSLHGDVAVRRNLQKLLACDAQPTQKETEQWLADFAPWRALMGAHLWRQQSATGY